MESTSTVTTSFSPSTKCKQTLKSIHQYNQCLSEIRWIENKIKEVELQMQKRPSKVRHRNDLLRQLHERLDMVKDFESRN